MENLTGTCSLCGKELPMEQLGFLSVIEDQVKNFANALLLNEQQPLAKDLDCCTKRGLCSTATFCPECKAMLDKECEQQNKKQA